MSRDYCDCNSDMGVQEMDDAKSLSFRLESYLLQLSDICRRWTEWLAGGEAAATSQNLDELRSLEPIAAQLFAELEQVLEDRRRLLADAQLTGLPHHNLNTLARHLPAWEKSTLRSAMALAGQQLSSLRRLHVATWVLLHHATQFYDGTLHLLMAGSQPHVYVTRNDSDTCGGRLLDASA
jgi:hypothetical protein